MIRFSEKLGTFFSADFFNTAFGKVCRGPFLILAIFGLAAFMGISALFVTLRAIFWDKWE